MLEGKRIRITPPAPIEIRSTATIRKGAPLPFVGLFGRVSSPPKCGLYVVNKTLASLADDEDKAYCKSELALRGRPEETCNDF